MNEPYMTNSEIFRIQQEIRKQFARSGWYIYNRDRHLSKTKGKRGGHLYRCSHCLKDFPIKDMNLHHVKRVVREGEHYSDINFSEYIRRVWCEEDNLVLLCLECHVKEHSKDSKSPRRKNVKRYIKRNGSK